jgi:hypothetical protein
MLWQDTAGDKVALRRVVEEFIGERLNDPRFKYGLLRFDIPMFNSWTESRYILFDDGDLTSALTDLIKEGKLEIDIHDRSRTIYLNIARP